MSTSDKENDKCMLKWAEHVKRMKAEGYNKSKPGQIYLYFQKLEDKVGTNKAQGYEKDASKKTEPESHYRDHGTKSVSGYGFNYASNFNPVTYAHLNR